MTIQSFRSIAASLTIVSMILIANPAGAVTLVHDDHFDDGTLGTNASGVGGGYVKNSSNGNNSFTVTESGTVALVDENSGAAQGIASVNGFDLSGGVIATWDIASYDHNGGGTRRTFYALQGSNDDWLFGGSLHPSIVIELNPAAVDPDTARLRLHAFNGSSTVHETQEIANIIIQDFNGFTLTADYRESGYTITSTGLNTVGGEQVNISGNWDAVGNFSFASLFQTEDLHASAYIQNQANDGNSGTFEIDRITLLAIPEPATAMLGLLSLCGLAMRRHR